MIEVKGLVKKFGNETIFNHLDMTINDGEVVGIIGPSGTGKSILLRCMMMLEKPDSGEIYLDGNEITAKDVDIDDVHKKVGMVFQDYNLFSHLSAIENVMSGMIHLQKAEPNTAYDEAMSLLRMVGLSDKAYFYPKALSGGQKQRVAIARTLAMKPSVILMDEPTSALDQTMRGEVEAVIRMMKDKGHTIVIVSHEMEFVKSICNRICFINKGVVFEEGTPEEIFENPKQDETRRFIKALRVLDINIESKSFDFIGMQTTIREFAYRNGIPHSYVARLLSIMEELSQMVIIQPNEENRLFCSFEYNNKESVIEGEISFTGEEFDPDNPTYFISWPIIQRRATEVSYGPSVVEGFTNRISIKIKE